MYPEQEQATRKKFLDKNYPTQLGHIIENQEAFIRLNFL
jgi:hypothetical protein